MRDEQAAYKAAMKSRAKRSAMSGAAALVVTALLAMVLAPLDRVDEGAANSPAVAAVPHEAEQADGEEEDAVLLETELVGYWSWGWYHFNRWETQAIAAWTPWDDGSRSRFAVEQMASVTKYGYVFLAYYGIMWSYKRQAQSALAQGKCLKIAWSGISWAYRC